MGIMFNARGTLGTMRRAQTRVAPSAVILALALVAGKGRSGSRRSRIALWLVAAVALALGLRVVV